MAQSMNRREKRIALGFQNPMPNSSKLTASGYLLTATRRNNKHAGFSPANKKRRK